MAETTESATLERERAREGRELAPPRPPRGRLPGAPRRADRRQRGRPPRRSRAAHARLRRRPRPPRSCSSAQLVAASDERPAAERRYAAAVAKVEPILYGDRKVFTVSAFNHGVATYLGSLPAVWVEGEVTELRRNEAWANVFVTLKDPKTGATLKVTIARRAFDRLELGLEEGETVHVAGRAELYEQKGELGLRATTIERIGLGDHLLALERLKRQLAAEGLFAPERKRPLPRFPSGDRHPHGRRRRRARRPRRHDRRSVPGDQGRHRARHASRARAQPRAIVAALEALERPPGGGRRRPRARRRELRGPALVQRRGGRAGRRRLARVPSSPRSGTSRTLPSATSRPTFARQPRLRPERSSFRRLPSCRPRSTRARRRAALAARGLVERRHDPARAARRAAARSALASSSSAAAPRSTTPAHASRRSLRSRL